MTFAPPFAKRIAVAAPIPTLAPVTSTVFPTRREVLKTDIWERSNEWKPSFVTDSSYLELHDHELKSPCPSSLEQSFTVVGMPWNGYAQFASRAAFEPWLISSFGLEAAHELEHTGAGYGLFATTSIQPSTPLFSIPATALMNYLTLQPHYPASRPKLSCTQVVSMHLLLYRPADAASQSEDTLFGPFISMLPLEVDWHPLTWLWKESVHGSGSLQTQVLDALPRSIVEKLNKMFGLFESDWKRVQDYLRENPTVASRRSRQVNAETVRDWEGDYLWAWLIVNTRCIYHRLAKTRSSPDNLTLCPILDFANHTHSGKFMCPGTTQVEMFDTGPSPKRKLGENFVLLSPSTSTVVAGDQLFLRYGMHANSTLFTDYGFVNVVDWHNLPESFQAEVEVDSYVEALFEQRGELGVFMKNILIEEGYWRDWTMQALPLPTHAGPSYRLVTALRLYHVFPSQMMNIPSRFTERVDEWRNTTLGKQDVISEDNERDWRESLMRICKETMVRAGEGLWKTKGIKEDVWLKTLIERLWEEERYVANEVMKSLDAKIEF